MGEVFVHISAEGVGGNLCMRHSTCKKAGFEHSSCACCSDEKFKNGIGCGQDGLAVEEIGKVLSEVMHIYDESEFDESDNSDLDDACDESDDPPRPMDSNSSDDLVDDDPPLTSPLLTDGNAAESSCGKSDDGNSLTKGTPGLVSAMKGSRAKQGISSKLSVTWAPDVYDPPVTSESHTVKLYKKSPRKDYYKYKSSKSSSSNRNSHGSKKDNKHSRRSSSHSSSSSSNGSKRDKRYSHRSSRIGANDPCHQNLMPVELTTLKETRPAIKTMEQLKCSTSYCKEQPLDVLSFQLPAARYKGLFSAWDQNQLAS